MIVELITEHGEPITLLASQILIKNEDNTPLAVAANYGAPGLIKLSVVGDKDFSSVLKSLGYNAKVEIEYLKLDEFKGARLIAGPGVK